MKRTALLTAGVLVLACLSRAAEAADPDLPPAAPVPLTPPPAGPSAASSWSYSSAPAATPLTPPPAGPSTAALSPPPLAGDAGPVWHFDDANHEPDGQPQGHFVAGAGIYLIKPFFDTNPAFHTTTTTTTGSGFNSTTTTQDQQQDLDHDLAAAPLLWIGYVGANGLGIRGRWWSFDQASGFNLVNDGGGSVTSAAPQGLSISSPAFSSSSGTNPDTLIFNSRLRLDVWDLEATQDFRLGGWGLTVSGGARYVHLAQNYNAYRYSANSYGPGFVLNEDVALESGHNFNGAGPTVSVEARRPLGCCGLSVYGNVRGSLLYGQGKQETTRNQDESGLFFGTPFDSLRTNSVAACRDDLLPIVEVELGAEYGADYGRCHPFVRTGVVGQTWFGAGNATSVTGNLGFLGLTATAGVHF